MRIAILSLLFLVSLASSAAVEPPALEERSPRIVADTWDPIIPTLHYAHAVDNSEPSMPPCPERGHPVRYYKPWAKTGSSDDTASMELSKRWLPCRRYRGKLQKRDGPTIQLPDGQIYFTDGPVEEEETMTRAEFLEWVRKIMESKKWRPPPNLFD